MSVRSISGCGCVTSGEDKRGEARFYRYVTRKMYDNANDRMNRRIDKLVERQRKLGARLDSILDGLQDINNDE